MPPSDPVSVVARALGEVGLALSSEEARALATSQLRRWPTLQQHPALAHFPLVVLIRGFLGGDARPFVEHGASALAVFDPEVEGVAAGLRAGCLKEGIPSAMADGLIRAYQAMGLQAGEIVRHALDEGTATQGPGSTHAVVAVARTAQELTETIELQRRSLAGHVDARRRIGAWLGYPPCCIDAFLSDTKRGDNVENERQPFLRHPTRPLNPLLHRLGLVRLISHHLCSPDCAASAVRAGETLELMRRVDAPGAAWAERELARPVLFADYGRRARLSGRWSDERFEVTRMEPVGDGRWLGMDPADVRAVEISPQGIRLLGQTVTSVAVSRPLLTTPMAPLHPAALRALQRLP